MQGKVKFFNSKKGYGFIVPDGGGKDVFFHFSEFQGDHKVIQEGNEVEFSIANSNRGVMAQHVILI